MNEQTEPTTQSKQSRWNRQDQVVTLENIKSEMTTDQKSQRQLAVESDVPRSTLQYWLKRGQAIDAEPALVEFFESEVGLAFLHRLVLGLHMCLRLFGNVGIRLICLFLKKTGLDAFVASSYHAQQKIAVAVEEEIVVFGKEEKHRLAPLMSPKFITLCEDENFHEDLMCLLAMEPVSNMIIVEQYAKNRDAATWNSAVNDALTGLPVKVIQSTSDAAKGLLLHVKSGLGGAHHSPDLFHVLQDLSKATARPLALHVEQSEQAHVKATEAKQVIETAQTLFDVPQINRQPGKRPDFEKIIKEYEKVEENALNNVSAAQSRQTSARESVRGISDAYHPFDIQTGELRSADQVRQDIGQKFSILRNIAEAARLSDWSDKLIAKAQRQVDSMVATIAFVHHSVQVHTSSLELTSEQADVFISNLVSGVYIKQLSSKAQQAEERHTLTKTADQLLQPLREPGSPFAGLSLDRLQKIEKTAMECANLFQRSSSCVEGRNGQLALHHHHLHRISARTLQSLTVIHNYFIKRRDGTTAAERFFGNEHRDLFEWLLDRISLPARPAKKRVRPLAEMALLAA